MNIREAEKLKRLTKSREFALFMVKSYAHELKTLNQRFDFSFLTGHEDFKKEMEQFKENDKEYCLREIKKWAQRSLDYKQEIDKLKRDG